jgi:hypothetical protein
MDKSKHSMADARLIEDFALNDNDDTAKKTKNTALENEINDRILNIQSSPILIYFLGISTPYFTRVSTPIF